MKRGPYSLYLLIFLTLSISVSAQKKLGDENYARYNYRAAINCYLKAISSNPKDTASLIHLANCYGILRDYDNAEIYYARAVTIPNIPASVFLNYGKILKNNGKIDEARAQFVTYSNLVPTDMAVKDEIRYCDNLKKKLYITYQVNTIDGINTKYSEFGPVLFKDNLVFVSDRGENMVEFDKSGTTGGNYFKIFTARPSANSFTKPEGFSSSINGVNDDNNVGPATFTADGKTMLYTRVAAIRKKNFVNQAKIFYCTGDGKTWEKSQEFQYNSDSYSVMDPAISADGQWLYFASNMPGGYGGTDIYECHKTADGWSKPQNLGAEVNTPGNEAFPYLRKDGILFFSSDRHFNYGGLDIFSAEKVDVLWTDVENLGPDINSSTDDFGICFNSNGRTGYFSSNRKGGAGADDIYGFLYIGDYKPLKGLVLFSYNVNDPVPGVGVDLVNDSGRVIASGKTDSNGTFLFSKLDPDKRYIVRVNETDPRFAGKKRFYLADSTGKIVGVTITNSTNDKFSFTQLPPDLSRLPKMDAIDKNINIAGSLLHGDSSKPMANIKIDLLNANGKVMASTSTNEFGSFVFSNLPPDENYMFRITAQDNSKLPPNTRVVITDKNGNTIKTISVGAEGSFRFELLASDTTSIRRMKVEDAELRLTMKSTLLGDNKERLAGVKVNLTDKNGNIIESRTTDQYGEFSFSNLPLDKTYFEQVDATDPKLRNMNKLFIADSKGNIVRELDMQNGDFKFEVLPSDRSKMGYLNIYDPWLTALNLKNKSGVTRDSLYIIENIYYDYQKWDILPSAAHVLDKVISVMRSDPSISIELDAYTDPRGTAEFNLDLSQKRADAAVAYMVVHGIDRSRLIGKGFGKARQVNNCSDPGVICNEEQYAKNRRTEFKLTRKQQ
jgi:outer membrane protein OmpA-like peptidoglycan-associated protein/tetratricopeptide (TPR) repeat protein